MSVMGSAAGIKHGTMKGYRQHRYRKATMCDACRQAELDYQVARRAGRPTAGQAEAAERPASETQKAWNAGQFTPAQMASSRRRQKAAAAEASMPRLYIRPYPPYLPGHIDPAWGEPIDGADLAVGDVLVHLGRHYPIDREEPYEGSLDAALGKGARTVYSGAWDMAVGPDRTIRILPREGR